MSNWKWTSLNANAGLKANGVLKADAVLLHDGFIMQVEHPCARLRDPATTKTGGVALTAPVTGRPTINAMMADREWMRWNHKAPAPRS